MFYIVNWLIEIFLRTNLCTMLLRMSRYIEE